MTQYVSNAFEYSKQDDILILAFETISLRLLVNELFEFAFIVPCFQFLLAVLRSGISISTLKVWAVNLMHSYTLGIPQRSNSGSFYFYYLLVIKYIAE